MSLSTPPATPTSKATRTSEGTDEMCGRRSIDSVISDRPLDATAIKEFPYHTSDYSIIRDRKLGEGLWSLVYQAHPAPAGETPIAAAGLTTPPMTPTKGRSRANTAESSSPSSYAIKYPASRSARNVLTHEARIFTALSSAPDAKSHIIPFYGRDSRSGSLVLGFMPHTLESYVTSSLNTLSEDARASKLAQIFPSLALHLIEGMRTLHGANVIHADLKPSNILLDPSTPMPTAYYADFSSSILTTDPSSKAPLGAGTWDFLSPALLKSKGEPTIRTDIHSLAVCLLCVIFGQSPFDAVQHTYMKREMVKQNQALEAAYYLLQNFRRMQGLEKALGFGVEAWIKKALGDSELDLRSWGAELRERRS